MPLEPYVREPSGTFRSLLDRNRTVGASAAYPQINAISATGFRDYYSTRIFPTYVNKTYNELHNPTGLKWLTDMSLAGVSHKIEPNWHGPTRTLVGTLGARGTKSLLTVGEPHVRYTSAQWDDMIGEIAAVGDHLLMVNGQNEINHARAPKVLPADWLSISVDHQQELWTRMNGANGTGGLNATRQAAGKSRILVGSPNLWSGNVAKHHADLATVAPLVRAYCDVACYHLYPRGEHPTWKLDEFISKYRDPGAYGASKVLWCTEAGYFDAANAPAGGAVSVTQWAKDIYQRKQWLEYAKRGVRVSYFEFLDDVDPADTDRESSLGMIDTPAIAASTWKAKASYTNLKTMLARQGGVAGKVSCEVTTTGNVETLAVNGTTGTVLYVWRTDNIEVNRQRVTLSPPTVPVTVSSPNITTTTVNVGADVVTVPI